MRLGIFRKTFTELYELTKMAVSFLDYFAWLLFSPSKFKKIKTKEIDNLLVILITGKKGNVGGNAVTFGVLNYFKKLYSNIKVSVLVDKITMNHFGKLPGIELIEYKGLETLKKLKDYNFKAVLDLTNSQDFTLNDFRFISYRVMPSCTAIFNFFRTIKNNFSITRKVFFPWNSHTADMHFNLLETLGFKFSKRKLIFHYSKKDEVKVRKFLKKNKLQKFIILHPGGKHMVETVKKRKIPSQLWPFENYAKVADHFSKKDYKIVITGIKEERFLADKIKQKSSNKTKIIDSCGQFTVRELAFLLKNSKLLISTDTGVVHLAYQDPINTPIVELFGVSIPEVSGAYPINSENHKFLFDNGICARCNHQIESPENLNCLKNIKVREVIRESEELLKMKK